MSEHMDLLKKVADLTMLTFMVSNMLGFGMRLSLAEIIEPLRQAKPTLKALLANFVIVPAVAYALVHVFHLEGDYAIGLLLVACSAGVTRRALRARRCSSPTPEDP